MNVGLGRDLEKVLQRLSTIQEEINEINDIITGYMQEESDSSAQTKNAEPGMKG